MHACFIYFHCLRILLFELMMRFFYSSVVAIDLGRCLRTFSVVMPGQVVSWLFLMACRRVDVEGLKRAL
jgi:hypothetical protein